MCSALSRVAGAGNKVDERHVMRMFRLCLYVDFWGLSEYSGGEGGVTT